MVPRDYLVLEEKGGGFFVVNHEVESYYHQEKKERFVAQRMVVKIGSSTITEGKTRVDTEFINDIARQASILFHAGVKIVIVSSGAVDTGNILIKQSGKDSQNKKKAALFGQSELTAQWVTAFGGLKVIAGVHLVSEDELEKAKELLTDEIMSVGVLVINGYDAVNDDSEEERRNMITADNDKLAAFVSRSINADTSLFLTDVDGVLDEKGSVIPFVDRLEDIEDVIIEKGSGGTGGMWGKCIDAKHLAREGQRSIIANGKTSNVLLRIARGENLGTRFGKGWMIY